MSDIENQWDIQVRQISAECVLYQTLNLIERLNAITEDEYPQAACEIKESFTKLAEWIKDALRKLADVSILSYSEQIRVRKLARFVQSLNSRLRFLEVSNPIKSPPVFQNIVNFWIEAFITEHTTVTAVVRPQWHYNLEYRLLTEEILGKLLPAELDPDLEPPDQSPSEFLQKILGNEEKHHLSVLSFASLDTDDTLLISLLGHEFGHLLEQIETDLVWEEKFRAELRWKTHTELDKELKESGISNPEARADLLQLELNELTLRHKKEILADLVATRIMGFGYFVAHAETLKTLASHDLNSTLLSGYPPTNVRLKHVLKELLSAEGLNFQDFLEQATYGEYQDDAKELIKYLESWNREVNTEGTRDKARKNRELEIEYGSNEEIENAVLSKLLKARMAKALPLLIERARILVPSAKAARYSTESFFSRIKSLRQEIPPLRDTDSLPTTLAETLSSAWAFQLLSGNKIEHKEDVPEYRYVIYKRTCRLVLKAIELSGQKFQNIIDEEGPSKSIHELFVKLGLQAKDSKYAGGGVYNFSTIVRRMDDSCDEIEKISLVPAFPGCIQGASVDVHLGNWFKVFKRASIESIPFSRKDERSRYLSLAQHIEYRHLSNNLVMHPGDLVLGCTLEFLSLPLDTVASVDGKSQLGRLGLIVATATQIAPGFHGVVVLELVNAGMIPFTIVPGMQIAQLVFRGLSEPVPEELRYKKSSYCQIMP